MTAQDREHPPDLLEKFWSVLGGLIAPDPGLRSQALDELGGLEGFPHQPLLVFGLATRLIDPDLEVRSQAVKLMGSILAGEGSTPDIGEDSLAHLSAYLAGFNAEQYVMLLEVSAAYLAGEEAVGNILRVSSFAGRFLRGIVNNRKLPVDIRQQAVFFCGEIGFLDTAATLKNLVERIEKHRDRAGIKPGSRAKTDQEALYLQAVSALSKLE